MEDLYPRASREALFAELTEDRFLRSTSKAGNQLYLVNIHNSPHLTREVGRLREIAFRSSGGGTGKSLDLDTYDLADPPYEQLIVWDPEDQEITAGYRLVQCRDLPPNAEGSIETATTHLFEYSQKFEQHYVPYTIELGRSFVQPQYQRGSGRKGLFALDNLWDGLAAVMLLNPHLRYLFGKVTMYPSFNREGRNMILAFMHHFFPDPDRLVTPRRPLLEPEELRPVGQMYDGLEYKNAHQLLQRELKSRGEYIPPLINSYMGLSSTMRTFGTAENENFGKVEETGILVTFDDIHPDRKKRYIDTFEQHREFPGPQPK